MKQLFKDKEIIDNITNIIQNKKFSVKNIDLKKYIFKTYFHKIQKFNTKLLKKYYKCIMIISIQMMI